MNKKLVSILPSLSINVTDKCNLKCIYCPPNGENFINCDNLCEIESITELIHLVPKYGLPVIRLTGGEPLTSPQRVENILKACSICSKSKIILNTNGTKVQENLDLLDFYKNIFLLKISLDTVNENIYDLITQTNNNYTTVFNVIKLAVERGYKMEINTVITQSNIDGVMDVVKFADENNIDIKLFGINDFEGKVCMENLYIPIDDLVLSLDKLYQKCNKEGLPGERGIKMLKYITERGNQILVVDHNAQSKYNKDVKAYSKFCESCDYYPCASGLFSVTLRADGLLQTCRIRPEVGINISGLSHTEINKAMLKVLEPYNECYYI